MEHKYDILDSLKKSSKPDVPNDFFENFPTSLKVNVADHSEPIGATKKLKPAVPEDFFENFSDQLMKKIQADDSKEPENNVPAQTRFLSYRNISIGVSIAACIMLGLFIFNQKETTLKIDNLSAETESTEVSISESDEAYLAFLDEDELIDFLVENDDIELDTEDSEDEEDLYFLVDGEIEDFYLEDL